MVLVTSHGDSRLYPQLFVRSHDRRDPSAAGVVVFFQHIGALAASGITGGCRGGNFCPGDPLTRGQMAAFLATALGLHWGLPK